MSSTTHQNPNEDILLQATIDITDEITNKKLPVEELLRNLLELQQLQLEIAATFKEEQLVLDQTVLSQLGDSYSTFSKLPSYKLKAVNLAGKMKSMSDRVSKLKHRCGSLQLDAHKYATTLKKESSKSHISQTQPSSESTVTEEAHPQQSE